MVRVRIAPSPTGDPHVGTVYIALFNYVFAKKHGGQFILRIEDTDRTRSRPEWEEMILSSLAWSGLSWDEGPDKGGPFGPYRQSERGEIYKRYAEELVASGRAYPCFCTAERLAELRKAQLAKKGTLGYDGHCRGMSADEARARMRDGCPYVVRLKVPEQGTTKVQDALRGEVAIENAQVDDQVLIKSDGMPTYHLANVVDDHLMEITHVIRAEEWITSTPKHVLLYEAFGWELPTFVHMPLLRNQDKSKISKRKNPVSVNYYREAGFLPAALQNYLAMMGWTMPDGKEKFSLEQMIEQFSFDRISLGGPVFDIKKLTWLNGLYLRELAPEAFTAHLVDNVFGREQLARVAPLVQARVEKLEDFIDVASYFFAGELAYDSATLAAMIPKGRTAAEAIAALEEVAQIVDAAPVLASTELESALRALAEKLVMKPKELFMMIRLAVAGREATPPLFETMAVIGKERCRRRLRGVLSLLRDM